MRYKSPPPKLPVKQPPTAAAKGPVPDGTQVGAPQQEARDPLVTALDWHNTLDISVEPDGAPKDWLLRTVSKLYRSHYPIQFRIVSYCQARDTRESTLRLATQLSEVCNDAIDGLGTPPFGDVVLTWKRVGPSGKAAALEKFGGCAIVDDNNSVLKECRCRSAIRQPGALRRAGRAPRVPHPAPTPSPSCQDTRSERVPRRGWPPPAIGKGRPRTFSLTWHRRRLQLKRSKCTGFQHRLYHKFSKAAA